MSDPDALRYAVVRRNVDVALPWQVGDEVTTYRLAEPFPYADLPPHIGRHPELDRVAERALAARNPDDWRRQTALRCTCRSRRVIAEVLVHKSTGSLWAKWQPEKTPNPFAKHADVGVGFYPLHGVPNEQPCQPSIATCNGCKKHWLVLRFVDRIELLAIEGRPTYGARVAE